MFDTKVAAWVASIRSPVLTRFMHAITVLGSLYCILLGYILLSCYLYWRSSHKQALIFSGLTMARVLVIWIAKLVFHRTRPSEAHLQPEPGYSFPSGHSDSAMLLFSWIVCFLFIRARFSLFLNTTIAILGFAICLAVGFSRVYLSVHYATDVLSGFCLGLFYFFISWFYFAFFPGPLRSLKTRMISCTHLPKAVYEKQKR